MTTKATILALLQELDEYFDQRADVDDGIPNEAMRHLTEIRYVIERIEQQGIVS